MSEVIYYPERDQWVLCDGEHWLEVPEWARDIIRAQHECEIKPLRDENAKLWELCRDMLKTIQVMDEEWHSLTDFTTMAEAAEIYDFDAENAPEYDDKLRELGVDYDAD